MRRRDIYWSLFQKSEKRQIDDLRTDSIEVVFEVIPKKDQVDWLVWREGFRNWKPLADFPQLIIGLRQAGQVNGPSIPAPSPVPTERDLAKAPASATAKPAANAADTKATKIVATKTAAATRSQSATTVQDRLNRLGSTDDDVVDFGIVHENELAERDTRYKKKWEVRILTGAKPISNQTVDVSNRGMSLRDPVPKGLSRYFNVELVIGETVVPLMCSEIRGPDGKPSKRIRIEVNHNPNLLQSALLLS